MKILSLIIWAICGVVCYKMAEKQGRNVVLAAVLGLFFGLFAVVGYFIAGDKK